MKTKYAGMLVDKKAHGGDTALARFACRCQAVRASGGVHVAATFNYINIILPHVNSDDPHCIP